MFIYFQGDMQHMEKESLVIQESLENTFASNVFNDAAQRMRLPKNIYKMLRKTIDEGLPLDPAVADIVANAMKDWAIEKGAYCVTIYVNIVITYIGFFWFLSIIRHTLQV